MTQQINPVHAKAMLDSLQGQLANACANIASRDGTIAVQSELIKAQEWRIKALEEIQAKADEVIKAASALIDDTPASEFIRDLKSLFAKSEA